MSHRLPTDVPQTEHRPFDPSSQYVPIVDIEILNRITEKVIGCAFKLARAVKPGHSEKVCENGLVKLLVTAGLSLEQQKRVAIMLDGVQVGEELIDILVEQSVVVEIKRVKKLSNDDVAQCLRYLEETGCRLCLLLNFRNGYVDVRRIIK